jgi:RimJ/RimL family protein N-acetyltransferase
MISLKETRQLFRSYGVRTLYRIAVGAVRPSYWGIYLLSGQPDDQASSSIEVKTDLNELAQLREVSGRLPPEFYRDETAAQRNCFYAVEDGKLAGIVWAASEDHRSRFIKLAPGQVELKYLHVVPRFGGRGIAKHLLREACRQLLGQGLQGIYASIDRRNEHSWRAFCAVGFERIVEIRRPGLLGPRYLTKTRSMESWCSTLLRLGTGALLELKG